MSSQSEILEYGQEISEGPAESILAGVYRSVLNDLAVERSAFFNLVSRFVSKSMSGMSADAVSSTQTNNRNDFLRTSMTWKVFCKGFHVINAKKIDLTLRVTISPQFLGENGKEVVTSDREAVAHHTIVMKSSNVIIDNVLEQYNEDLGVLLGQLIFNFAFKPEEFHAILKSHAFRSQGDKATYEKIKAAQQSAKTMLLSKKVSWKTFIKALNILGVKRLEIGLTVHHRNGKQTMHGREVNFS